MDFKGRKSSREDESSGSGDVEDKKACTDCKTTKTPLWRGGPAGPKVCTHCVMLAGSDYRKKRSVMRLEKGPEKKREKNYHHQHHYCHRHSTITTATTTNTAQVVSGNGLISESLRMSLMVLGEEMMLQRPSIVKKQRCQRKRKLREEEQAAFSLMALSCGSVLHERGNNVGGSTKIGTKIEENPDLHLPKYLLFVPF
ncbi:GATA transcription factor 16-like [Populus alba x Populus x berolinensis]|nr:GATA transcription factor 16-like [Populus alba x Populus x berolinensis]